jgi:general secretion pathway protein G
MQAKRGFTLVEILIVVVILGILAAIVIPQFTQASTEAKTNSLCSDLQTLRSQIELYKVQHNDQPPSLDPNTFESQMIYCTDEDGNLNGAGSKVRDTTYRFGPYLERVPENPFNNLSNIVAIANRGLAGSDTAGWAYIGATGEIYADDDTDADGDAVLDNVGF